MVEKTLDYNRKSINTGQAKPTGDFVTVAATIGVIAAGVALFEVALIPGMAIGAAAVLAPKYVPKLRRLAGQLTTYGSPIFAEHRAPADDRTIATLRANGAIPLAKSNVPEFAGSHTFNPVWGYHAQSL